LFNSKDFGYGFTATLAGNELGANRDVLEGQADDDFHGAL
jgi:hypothetical protein